MVDMTTSRREAPRKQLLYDEAFLADIVDEFGNAIEIKENVKTTACIYEIRTAIEYWFGGDNSHRESDRIWKRCENVDKGHWAVVDEGFVYADEVEAGRP